jgi:CubicO group peptidase (beta-lactamase class C family)
MARIRTALIIGTLLWISQPVARGQNIATLPQMYDGAVGPDLAVRTLSHTELLLPYRVVARGTTVALLAASTSAFPNIRFVSDGKTFDLYDYLAINRVAGLLVLKDGSIALEDYELGIGPQTRWASFSMAKSVASTLIGAAMVDGYIASLDDPVERYVPALRGSGYSGVTLRQILTMTSGVAWNETYTDPQSDRRKVLNLQLAGKPGTILDYMATLKRRAPAGSVWNYSTGETFLLGAIIEGAVHKPLATYLSEKIWSKAGMERDATWWTESAGGVAWAGSGIAATLRDYGRFGLIIADDGRVDGHAIVPTRWFTDAVHPLTIGGRTINYGYTWWIPDRHDPIQAGSLEAQGIFGQHLYINPREQLVIVVLSARSKPEPELELDDDAFFGAVATALHR